MKKLDSKFKIISAVLFLIGIALLIVINTIGLNNEASQPIITKLVQYYIGAIFIFNICKFIIERNKKGKR